MSHLRGHLQNGEGLTYKEWLHAAGFERVGGPHYSNRNFIHAWEKGEDPSEYRNAAPKRVHGRASGNAAEDRAILEGMARAMYVTNWADEQEEKGRRFPPGTKLMEAAPVTSRDAKLAAVALARRFVNANPNNTLSTLYRKAVRAGGEPDPNKFGHYLAMQAMGHGVSWFDDNPEFPIEIPHFEYYRGAGEYHHKTGHAGGKRPSKTHKPWIRHEGALGGPGYHSKSAIARHRLLAHSIRADGYTTTLRRLLVLTRNHHMHSAARRTINADIKWLKERRIAKSK